MKTNCISYSLAIILVILFSLPAFSQDPLKIDSLLNELKTAKMDTNKVQILFRLTWEHMKSRSELETAGKFADSAMLLSKKLDYKSGIALTHYYYGVMNRLQGNYQNALKHLEHFQDFHLRRGDSIHVADGLYQKAVIYSYQGNYEESLSSYLRILKIYESIDEQYSSATTLNSIGIIYKNLEKYDLALESCNRALAMFKEIDAKIDIADCLHNIGNVYAEKEEYQKALDYYQESVAIDRELENKWGIAYQLETIGTVYTHLNRLDEALSYNLRALKIREEIGQKKEIAMSLNKAGFTLWKMGNYDEAIAYLSQGLATSRKIGSKPEIEQAYFNLAHAFAGKRQHEKAFEYYQLYVDIKDSIVNEASTKQINELQTQYETEKKEQEIALLTKEQEIQNAEIKYQRTLKNAFIGGIVLIFVTALIWIKGYRDKMKAKQLVAAKNEEIRVSSLQQQLSQLEMKALRAQMNPHFIFNCLSSINRMIMSKEAENATRYLTKFSKLIRLILENSESSTVPLANELEMLEIYIQLESERFKGKMEYTIAVDPEIDQEATRLPSMVIQPFIENAIWHGLMHKEDKGLIKISIKQENDWLKCIIEDNGIGREKALELKEKKLVRHKSMGMKVTKERLRLVSKPEIAEKLITITDLKDKLDHALGTRIDILIPIS